MKTDPKINKTENKVELEFKSYVHANIFLHEYKNGGFRIIDFFSRYKIFKAKIFNKKEVISMDENKDENKDEVKGMQPIYLNVKIATGTTVEEFERNVSSVAQLLPQAPGKWQFSMTSHKGELVGAFVDVDPN